ncbi:hypothetical protein, partial [Akkermansia sp.]|uniref:hypothetical protein n=1 Tax=Akkermansia sp. TaxID=1872421 RepID=UPI003AB8F92E
MELDILTCGNLLDGLFGMFMVVDSVSFVPEIKEDAAATLIKHELPVSSVSAEQEKEPNAVTVQEAATEAKKTQQVETEAIEKPTEQTAVEET